MHSKQALLLLTAALLTPLARAAETCTTQSQMQPADRDALAAAAQNIAIKVEANDQAGLRALTIPEYQKDFAGIGDTIANTAPRLQNATPQVEQVYLLDASTLTAPADAQFFCTLNKSQAEADFTIPQLPPGKYAFAMVRMESATPWRLSFLLRSEGGTWHLAGIYPKPFTAGGHDGLWYWQQSRTLKADKQPWNSWLYLQEAQSLLQPASFVSSTHLEKLFAELAQTAPPAIASGLSAEVPLVVKGKGAAEYRFTQLGVDDSLGKGQIDVAARFKAETANEVDAVVSDGDKTRMRNLNAMSALLTAYPELRKSFHGVVISAELPNGTVYTLEQAMPDIH